MTRKAILTLSFFAVACTLASAQKYRYIDKTVASVGNEAIMISDIEDGVKDRKAQGLNSDRNVRCEILESILESKLFLMHQDNVEGMLSQRIDQYLTYLGGQEEMEKYFGKPLYRLRQDWRQQYEDMSLTQEEQQEIMKKVPDMTPFDVKAYMDTVDLYPFQNLIDNGVEMIMLAHISVPDIDPSGVPMSISSKLINDILRGEQGFKGVVITDAIVMAGLTNENRSTVEATMAVYKSGSDMILMPDEPIKCIEALTKAVESGELPMEELDNKVRKVLMLKARAGYLEKGFNPHVKKLDRKIAAARRRDFRLIKKMRHLMEKSTKPNAGIKPRGGDVTLIFDKAGK